MTGSDEANRLGIRQISEGDHNQLIGSMAGNSKAIGSADIQGDLVLEPTVIRQAAERITSPFQLPRSVADFTGRDTELTQIYEALAQSGESGTVVISALAGMAGVGKSALAIHAAHQMKARFPDAQLFVNLQGAGEPGTDAQPKEPGEVLEQWLRALGIDGAQIPAELGARAAYFRSQLANKQALVVLDNARDAAQVRPLLPGGSGCAVIVTSRRGLDLAGTRELLLKTLLPEEALALLEKIAGQERIAAERAAAEEIVRLCGYLPLAVRIAGGVLKRRRDWELTTDYLPKLKNEQGRLDALQQPNGENVRASFNLSYAQLSEPDRRLFALLGTLPLDFGMSLMIAVCEQEFETVEEGVERLLDAQLIDVTQTRRYRYHDLMRLYAQEQLQPEERTSVEEKIFDWYWVGANYFNKAFDPIRRRQIVAQQKSAIALEEREKAFRQTAVSWFEAERIHLLSMFSWAYAQKKFDEVVYFAGNLGRFFQARSYWQDWESTHLQALSAAREIGDKVGEGKTRNNLGSVYRSQGRWEEAIEQYQQSLVICRELGDRHGEGQTLMNLGNLHQARIQPFKAQNYWQEALAKLHPDSPEAKRLKKQVENPLSTMSGKQLALGCALSAIILTTILIFIGFNIVRGHFLIAVLTSLALLCFCIYRVWRVRRGNKKAS